MCDENAEHFAELFRQAKVVPSTFIRTTDSRHRSSVQAMWNKLQSAGHIVKGSHSGYYSTNEETFFPEKDLMKAVDGSMRVPGSGEVCDFVTEENYVFKFNDSMKAKLVEWAEAVGPSFVRNKVLTDIFEQKFEISVSRPKQRLSWGIEVPDDSS